VYFDSTFLQNSLEVADYIPIYAIVNSLSELSNISRVQFVIDGSQDAVFREQISLAGTLSRDLNYIIQE
jgi:germination protein M